MQLTSSLRVSVSPASVAEHEEGVRKLAEKARKDTQSQKWIAYQTLAGQAGRYLYASEVESWADLATRERPPEHVVRLFGEKQGREVFEQISRGIEHMEQCVFLRREDLSHIEPPSGEPAPLMLRTVLRVSPGGQDTCEELIRRVSEAVPKVNDERRFATLQTLIGELTEYSIIQPIREPALLDRQHTIPELLDEAFGAAEGGLILRSGREAIQSIRTDLWTYRSDLSNPPEPS